ncbi:MAG: hypothetical protein ACR2O6_16305 [Ilumatobacteraceae bacterium]
MVDRPKRALARELERRGWLETPCAACSLHQVIAPPQSTELRFHYCRLTG